MKKEKISKNEWKKKRENITESKKKIAKNIHVGVNKPLRTISIHISDFWLKLIEMIILKKCKKI